MVREIKANGRGKKEVQLVSNKINKRMEEDSNGNSNKEDSGNRDKISKIVNSIVIENILTQTEVVFVVVVVGVHHKNLRTNMIIHLVHQITRKEIKVTRIEG